MPQLILAIFVFVLYLWWVGFLLGVIGPNLLVVLAIGLVGFSLAVLGRCFARVYVVEGRGWVYWLPAIVAVASLYYSHVRVLATFASETLVGYGLYWMISKLPELTLSDLLLGSLDVDALSILWIDSLLVGALLGPFVLFGRGIQGRRQDREEPAFTWYFHQEAWQELWSVTRSFWQEIRIHGRTFVLFVFKTTMVDGRVWFLWPLGVMAYLGFALAALQAGVVVAVWLAAFVIGLALVWLAAHYLAFLMKRFERAVLKVRAGYVKCPQALCDKPLPLPIFRCPQCGEAHANLVPGRCGIFARRCKCGKLLPTLNWFGKSRLPSECCHCGNALGAEMFGANLHVPIYGGRGAGKSTFLAAATDAAISKQGSGLHFGWVMARDREHFETQWRSVLRSGAMLSSTIHKLPDAFLLAARGEGGLPASVYLYDPSGEAMVDEADLGEHNFVGYPGGLVLLIDPMAFEGVRENMVQIVDQAPPMSPTEIVQRVVLQLESLAGLSRAKRFDKPVAVVISKVDLAPVAGRLTPDSDPATIREWLLELDAALVHNLETRFSNVSYFAVSALEAARTGAGAQRVLEPLTWLLSPFWILSRPRLVRWGSLTLEATAAVSLLAAGLAIPFVALLGALTAIR